MFLANENFPRPSTLILRQQGFEVTSIQELSSGISDEEVIEIALKLKLIILTFDSEIFCMPLILKRQPKNKYDILAAG